MLQVMLSNSTSSNTIAWLNSMNVQLNRYLPLPFLVLGTIGVILNIIIFTRRSLVINSCIHYLLANTVANFIVLYWVVITRIMSDGYKIDPSITSDVFCKMKYFLTYVSRTLSTWFLLLACIDRWASSPALMMLAFGLATLRNLRQTHRQVLSNGTQTTKSTARRDHQLFAMLIMQVALIIVFTAPFAGQKLYDTFMLNVKKSSLEIAQDNLYAGIVRILSYGFRVGANPFAMVSGKFNGDNYADLAVANFDSDTVSILLGTVNGTFENATNYAVGDAPASIAAGYFNGDSYIDLIVANFNNHTMSVLLGKGNGSFATANTFLAGVPQPRSIAVADMNIDGIPDVVVGYVNYGSSKVGVLIEEYYLEHH
ncbi:unnamed protein product [Rotaria sp. Silwood1]|nr:unnamed protein product [Rotaria sp. Silwood1]